MRHWTWVFAATLLVAAGGCASTNEGQALQVEQIYADGLCGRTRTEPAARWIADADELEQIRQQFGSYRLGPPALPEVNFDQRGVLLVLMGKRQTAGYALGLAETQTRLEKGVAKVTLDWRQPDEGAMTAQVMTSPCALFTLPKAGLERIDIYDQTGTQRLSVETAGE